MDDVDRDMNIVVPRTRWMDDVDRDMNIVRLERKMADDMRQWRRNIDEHCGTPDDETSRTKRRRHSHFFKLIVYIHRDHNSGR